MKFRCERDSLAEALSTAGRSVTARGSATSAALGLRIQVDGNRLTVLGTDLDLTIRVNLEAIGLDDGSFVAPARLATEIVRSLEPGAVTFEGGEDEVEISAARSRFVVRTYALARSGPSDISCGRPRRGSPPGSSCSVGRRCSPSSHGRPRRC